jgi:Flp pilus assembly protein TadG
MGKRSILGKSIRLRHKRRECGQALLELALTAPLLILALVWLAELGNGLNSYLTVVAAARDGARLGAQGGAPASAILNMVDHETERLTEDIPTGTSSCTSSPGVCIKGVAGGTSPTYSVNGAQAVLVRVCYDHPLILGVPGIVDGPIRMCSKTTMRLVEP